MKSKYLTIFGLLAVLTLIVSLLPMAKPETTLAEETAEVGILTTVDPTLQWAQVYTPEFYNARFVVGSYTIGTEVNKFVIGSDDKTFYALDIAYSENPLNPITGVADGSKSLYKSTNAGITWSDKIGQYLWTAMGSGVGFPIWDIAIAPDNPSFVAVVTDNGSALNKPMAVWWSDAGGSYWVSAGVPQVVWDP